MQIRRVVTGFDGTGRPAVLSDTDAPVVFASRAVAGYEIAELCLADAVPARADQVHTEERGWQFVPEPGSLVWRVVVRPPERTGQDIEGLLDEIGAAQGRPDETPDRQPGTGGTHRTATMEWLVILSGELHITIGEGPEEVRVGPGDMVVQGPIPRSLHNRGTEPCVMAGVMLGVVE